MGRKATPGLFKRGQYWHIDKCFLGCRIRESTGTGSLQEAERYLNRRLEEIREASVYGVRPERVFKQAATKFLLENQHKRSIRSDAGRLKVLVEWIGHLPLTGIHMGSLQPYIEARRKAGVKTRTINHGLEIVRRILNMASSEWMDEHGLTWLAHAPKIKLLPEPDLRKPYPLSWEEQQRLFAALPSHLENMALFAVNTGCRDREICDLRWAWEITIPEMSYLRVFMIPSEFVKNGDERLVVCNDIARSVIDSVRGQHKDYVFTYKGKPISRMLNSAWSRARQAVDLPHVRVHDLKHTFGRRLRAAGVSFEDRQDLLGHRSGRITTHYSAAELHNLYEAANRVCDSKKSGVVLRLVRRADYRRSEQRADSAHRLKAGEI